MECVSQTPMVVTFDDMSNLKVILLNKFKIKGLGYQEVQLHSNYSYGQQNKYI
jgi:hypothetical protein